MASDEGSLHEIAKYSPYYLPLNVFTASKGPNLYFVFIFIEIGPPIPEKLIFKGSYHIYNVALIGDMVSEKFKV